MLQNIDCNEKKLQGLIMAPTRELAQQIFKVVLALGEYLNVKAYPCVGGTNVKDDILSLKDGVHIVVGTPGRVFLFSFGIFSFSFSHSDTFRFTT
jgi:translation initiation factor 4A